jgi:hypothetical protein
MPALCLCAFLVVAAQQAEMPAAAQAVPTLSFQRIAVKAGETAALPVYLVSEENYEQPMQVTVEFPKTHLTFEKVERDYLAEKANWKITATASDHPQKKDIGLVKVDIDPGPAKFFPSGLVARVYFQVAKGTPDGDILLTGALAAPASSKAVALSAPAKISVFTNAVFACFFYMH